MRKSTRRTTQRGDHRQPPRSLEPGLVSLVGPLVILGSWMSACERAVETRQPGPEVTASSEAADTSRCKLYAGEPRDPDVDGGPAPAPRCCSSDYGLDPELVRTSCGFSEYLGESEELACVQRFRDADGAIHELRVTSLVGLSLEAATQLLVKGGLSRQGEAEIATWSGPSSNPQAQDTWRWALVPGWASPRRLAWQRRACSSGELQPVLEAMRSAPPQDQAEHPLPRLDPPPEEPSEIPPGSLLASHHTRPIERSEYPLPRRASVLAHDVLATAARSEPEPFLERVSASARWGLPDRRQIGGRPIRGADEGAEVMTALRSAAARLPADAVFRCPAADRRVIPAITRGEHLQWCFWISPDQRDLLVFGLRGQAEAGHADGRVEYIGVFPRKPVAPLPVPSEPPPPPLSPRPELTCGDPHTADHPGVCPEPEQEDEPEAEQEDEH